MKRVIDKPSSVFNVSIDVSKHVYSITAVNKENVDIRGITYT